jgi:hypothetical protein
MMKPSTEVHMMPVSPIQVEVKPENSCNNWKCCFGWKFCWKKKEVLVTKIDSPASVESIEKVVTTYERHHIHHVSEDKPKFLRRSMEVEDLSAIRRLDDGPVRLPAPPPLVRVGNEDLPRHLHSASQALNNLNEEKKEATNEN